ncbi:MAG: CopG family transcriptional regulator [Acidimicrobiia bacterium]
MQRTNIFLTEEQQKRLRHRAREEGVSKSELIRDILDEALSIKPQAASVEDAIRSSSGLWADRTEREVADVLAWRREAPLHRLSG